MVRYNYVTLLDVRLKKKPTYTTYVIYERHLNVISNDKLPRKLIYKIVHN